MDISDWKRGLWSKDDEKPPVWYSMNHPEDDKSLTLRDGTAEGELPASPHGEATLKVSVAELCKAIHMDSQDSARHLHHLTLVTIDDIKKDAETKELAKIGIVSPGWYRWRMITEGDGVRVAPHIEAELLVFMRSAGEKVAEKAPEEVPGDPVAP